jgi:hypothetical protein
MMTSVLAPRWYGGFAYSFLVYLQAWLVLVLAFLLLVVNPANVRFLNKYYYMFFRIYK